MVFVEGTGENGVLLMINSDGKVKENLDHRIISTSEEMQQILDRVVPKVTEYFELLLEKELKKGGKG